MLSRWWRRLLSEERGATAILVALMLVVIFMAAAFTIDIGMQSIRRQTVRNGTDSAVLAGASLLPTDPNGAKAQAIQYMLSNDPNLTAAMVDVTFRCLIGDRDGDGLPDLADVPGACDPGLNGISGFTCDRGLCTAPCVPSEGDICNTIVTQTSESLNNAFARAAGGNATGTTGNVKSAACSGFCGAVPKLPIDVGLIIDRTASMSSTDLVNAKNAANSMLGFFDPKYNHVALGVIHKSTTASQCTGGGYGKSISTTEFASGSGTWVAAPYPAAGLYSDYQKADGTLNPSSTLVKTINCLVTSSFSGVQTDIGDPLTAMVSYLNTRGRAGVPKVVVLETDGEANLPAGQQPCAYAAAQGAAAKTAGVEVYTIGFGIGGKLCGYDTLGAYKNVLVTKLLAGMATQPSVDNGCVPSENTDGDHFFCEPKAGDLSTVFLRVAAAITAAPRLVRLGG